jgi:hypothetical protein
LVLLDSVSGNWRLIGYSSLSKAGLEVIIKSVLQSIPTYFMSIFIIPSSLCDEIEKIMNSFWWRHSGTNNKGIHWLLWEKLSMHKTDMLGKQGWRVMNNQNILIAKLFKARYFSHSDFLESKLGHNPSFVWRSLCNSKFILRAGSRWRIGDGMNIPLLNENWMTGASCLTSQQSSMNIVDNLMVSDIISHQHKCWNLPLINSIFEPHSAAKILKTPLYSLVAEDKRIWRGEQNGEYSVRSAYRLCTQELIDTSHLRVNEAWNLIWKIKIPAKVKNLIWRICRRCIPTRVRLRDRGVNCSIDCVLCNGHDEDNKHLLFTCPSSLNIWSMSTIFPVVYAAISNASDATALIFQLLHCLTTKESSTFACILWSIWKQRNNKL